MENVNWIAVVVAAFVPMILGFLWYGPMLFQKAWMKSLNFTDEDVQGGNMGVIMGLSLVLAFLLSVFVQYIVVHGDAEFTTLKHGAFHGFMIAVLAAVPVLVTNSLFERKSRSNILINVGYWIVTITVMGAILSAWR